MAKTETKLTRKQAHKAYDKLQKAIKRFDKALADFQLVYDPDTVSIEAWRGSLFDTLFEVADDMDDTFPSED